MWRSLFLVAVSGCYYFYPHGQVPAHGKPVPEPGARIELDVTKVDVWNRTCNSSEIKDERCELHKGKLMWRTLEYKVHATYQGNPLSQGEFYMLADPTYDGRVEHIRSKNTMCNVSLVPSTISLLGFAAAMAALVLDNNGEGPLGRDKSTVVMAAGFATFGAGALVSYPLGGYACWSAHGEADKLGLSSSTSTVWYFDRKEDA